MQENTDRRDIPYQEYYVIVQLLQAHLAKYQDLLKAVVAFGDLVTGGDTFDIDLLEVIEGWDERRFGRFSGPVDPPLRGSLRLYFLTSKEFEDPGSIQEPKERQWVEGLLERVRRGYEVITEPSPGWVQSVLDRQRTYSPLALPPSGSVDFADPFKLTRKE